MSAGCFGSAADWCSNIAHTPISRRNFLIGVICLIVLIVVIIILAATLSAHGGSVIENGGYVLKHNPLVLGYSGLLEKLKADQQNILAGFNFSTANYLGNLDNMMDGQVGAQIWPVILDCNASYKDAVAQTLEEIDVVQRLVLMNSNHLKLVDKASDIREAFSSKKIAVLLAISGQAIDSRLALIRIYWQLGVRIVALDGKCSLPWVDQTSQNLTPFGQMVIDEISRLGMVIDLTGSSSTLQKNVLSKVAIPVLFSHSNAFNLTHNKLNIKDDVLQDLKKNGGIVMVSFNENQLKTGNETSATLDDVYKHIMYLKNTLGLDHVGIGSAVDVTNENTIVNSTSAKNVYQMLFNQLYNGGVTADHMRDIATNNFIRILTSAEQFAKKEAAEPPKEGYEPEVEFGNNTSCYTDFQERYKNTSSSTTGQTTQSSTKITTTTTITPKTTPKTTPKKP